MTGMNSDDHCEFFTVIFHVVGMSTISALSIACIILFSKNLIVFSDIDLDGTMYFVRTGACSEGPLQLALEKGYDALVYERMLNRLALAFVVIAYGTQIIVALFFTDFKYILCLCLCKTAKDDMIAQYESKKMDLS